MRIRRDDIEWVPYKSLWRRGPSYDANTSTSTSSLERARDLPQVTTAAAPTVTAAAAVTVTVTATVAQAVGLSYQLEHLDRALPTLRELQEHHLGHVLRMRAGLRGRAGLAESHFSYRGVMRQIALFMVCPPVGEEEGLGMDGGVAPGGGPAGTHSAASDTACGKLRSDLECV